jgi:ferredoxin-NADP reductase
MKVIINNNIYDITTFISEHPGGANVFTENNCDIHDDITDLTDKFNEVGHSEYAVNLLGNYKVEELSEDDPRFKRDKKLEYNKTKISKLITHEDTYHVHKSMGIISLLNYVYLFFDFFYSGATAEITLRGVDGGFIGLTWVHTILSLSALQFLIPRTRTGILPMIWQEFRAHSIIFAARSFLIINALYFLFDSNDTTSLPALAMRLAFILIAMKLADISTDHLRENRKETTTATMPYWSDCPASLQSTLKYFYTHSQMMATVMCLFGKIPYILAVAFPIQFASFLMTLVRKNIISAFWYHMLYSCSLFLGYLIDATEPLMYATVFIGFALIYARVNLKVNKYILWTVVALTGGFFKYATSEETTMHDIISKLKLFAIPMVLVYTYYLANNGSNVTFSKYVSDIIFDREHTREESNHRVENNITYGKREGEIYNKITVQLCEKYEKYKPGMYFNLYFDTKKRPYTPIELSSDITSSSKGDTATFLIKRTPNGEVSPNICDKYLINQTVYVKGPFGRKYYDTSPEVKSFVCDTIKITAKYIVMCSCGSGITPFYSMGIAWSNDDITQQSSDDKRVQELHYISSYRTREDALLRVSLKTNNVHVKERLFISNENTKLTPATLIDYLTDIIENPDETNTPHDIAVFICGTPAYSQMIKDACSIISNSVKCYEW